MSYPARPSRDRRLSDLNAARGATQLQARLWRARSAAPQSRGSFCEVPLVVGANSFFMIAKRRVIRKPNRP